MLAKLFWLISLPVAEPCTVRVAHCIVGHVRTFWQEAVYQSIADVLVPQASPRHCADFFYVLSMSSGLDTANGGVYEYNERILDKCLLRREMHGEVWNCDGWIERFCESEGIPISLLKFLADDL